jgi:hypothetical protein
MRLRDWIADAVGIVAIFAGLYGLLVIGYGIGL